MALQIQEVAPTDSRGGPQHVCGVAFCSMWHFILCGEWILEVAPTYSKGDPHYVCGVPLCSVCHLVPFRIRRTLAWSWNTSSSSRHQACLLDAGMTVLLIRVTVKGTGVQGIQEYQMSGNNIIIMPSPCKVIIIICPVVQVLYIMCQV